jgi:hypothetical protein
VTPHALERDAYRRLHLGSHNRVALSGIAHTAAAYAGGPGWSPAPPGDYSDHHFLRAMLARADLRAASVREVTWLNFPSPARRALSIDERVAELERWRRTSSETGARAELDRELAAAWRRAVYEFDELSIELTEAYVAHETIIAATGAELAELRESRSWRLTAPLRALAARTRR